MRHYRYPTAVLACLSGICSVGSSAVAAESSRLSFLTSIADTIPPILTYANWDEFNRGLCDGYTVGLTLGQFNGEAEGRRTGESEGYDAGWQQTYQPAYDRSYGPSYDKGLRQGLAVSFVDSFAEGFQAADQYIVTSGGITFFNGIDNGGSSIGPAYDEKFIQANVTYYDHGYDFGYLAGERDGYNEAYPVAYAQAYDASLLVGSREGETRGTADGERTGYGDGSKLGREQGTAAGFPEGYDYRMAGGTVETVRQVAEERLLELFGIDISKVFAPLSQQVTPAVSDILPINNRAISSVPEPATFTSLLAISIVSLLVMRQRSR